MENRIKHIKVLRVIARLNIGGPAIHTILLTHFLNTSIETRLVVGNVSRGEESMDYLLEHYKVKPYYLNTLQRELSFAADIKSLFSIYKLIKEFKPDIVHTHTAKAGAVGRGAAILYNILHLRFGKHRVRIVHTFHGHVFKGYFNSITTSIFIWIERLLAIFTDRIIAVSDALKGELVNDYKIAKDHKIQVIYNGYDLKQFLDVEASSDLKKQSINITTVGRLVPIKGHKFLIKSFSLLTFPSELIIVGDGVLKQELIQLTEGLKLSNRVHFTGYVKDIVPIYRKTDIFVLSSLNEGAPVAIIEALACAKPVVATNVGGVKDLLGNTEEQISKDVYLCERGMLVPPADERAIAVAISYLVNNPKISYEISVNGRAFVSKFFTVDRLIKDISSLYRDILQW
ncbi:MAG: glycosyltransferase [bacterium]